MSLEGSVVPIAPVDGLIFISEVGILLFATLYFIFTLIVVRQVSLMTETLITEVSPLLRAFSIVYAGVALGIIILFIGLLFG